jgi:hypothetical protein
VKRYRKRFLYVNSSSNDDLEREIYEVFGTAPLPFLHLRSTNSTIEQLYCGVCGASGVVWYTA